jgi:hypothetical protein
VKSHAVPSHVAAEAPVGRGQVVHDVPQVLTSVSDAHSWPHACVPAWQPPEQGVA